MPAVRAIAVLLASILAAVTLVAMAGCQPTPAPAPKPGLNTLLGGEPDPGLRRALVPRRFEFPADHGAHPDFANEWWYFTGTLRDAAGRRFGYQLTVFRVALSAAAPAAGSAWSTNQIYMGHFAVTDAAAGRFHHFQRYARGALGLAGAVTEPLRIWVEDWQIEADADAGLPWRLRAADDDISIDLRLRSFKPPVLQGEAGLSQKSAAAGNASYYYSLSRLHTTGTLRIGDRVFAVTGASWLDREWGTSALAADQVGWDWFALQFDDGYELMYYQLRRDDGSVDPHSAGTLIDPQGDVRRLRAEDVRIDVLANWSSPLGGRYPARWRVHIPSADRVMDIAPVLANQELDTVVRYWEGAVDITAANQPQDHIGQGYVELTGYGR